MRTVLPAVLVVVVMMVSAGGWLWVRNGSGENAAGYARAETFVDYAHTTDGPLLPRVVVTATKLGQGRKALQGLPTTTEFTWPTLRDSEAGMALLLPGSTLPGRSAQKQVKALAPLAAGSGRRLKFDQYSWSMGTLVATTPQWIDLALNPNPVGVPAGLLAAAQRLDSSQRLMLLQAPHASGRDSEPGASSPLNPHDAHVLIADVLVPVL